MQINRAHERIIADHVAMGIENRRNFGREIKRAKLQGALFVASVPVAFVAAAVADANFGYSAMASLPSIAMALNRYTRVDMLTASRRERSQRYGRVDPVPLIEARRLE
ncbi:MAG: hypothetical protein KGH64_01190 [Candidatus Micrarchaeota archaeon]|nr:hypothetical protein [Candidatus Micrarchaeota archaeon]MDE1859869.1 hypothetical protein [Candidatus Micrarchaeota archaeon]